MIYHIDSLLNRITMYRLMLQSLIFLVISSSIFSLFGFLPYGVKDLLPNTLLVLVIGFFANFLFAKIFKAQTNIESVFITSLILILIMPISFPKDTVLLITSVIVAMGSKYLLAFKKRHIFNPAAVSAVIMSFVFGFPASWWVGSFIMLPLLLIVGILIIKKIQRFNLLFTFVGVYLLFVIFLGSNSGSLSFIEAFVKDNIPFLVFFCAVMLIEPLTSPGRKYYQLIYAGIVAVCLNIASVAPISFFTYISPEVALLLGNVFAFIVNPIYRFSLKFKSKEKLTNNTYLFSFSKPSDFGFSPGQYFEWTLPHKKVDSRGNRRFFTLSSSPTEDEIAITVKFYEKPSSFKKELLNLKEQKIIASNLSGEFTLPKNSKESLVFIAGGVGITPFRSMIQYIVDKNIKTDIILIYINKTKEEIVFEDLFTKAKENGVKTIYFLTTEKGHLDMEEIKKIVLDFEKRKFYLSGPQLMVLGLKEILLSGGVKRRNIKTDFFPGYSEK